MLKYVYDIFGLKYELTLSTRPEKYIGTIELWDNAEAILKQCIDKVSTDYVVDHQSGAFYGPKVDVLVSDSLNRKHQLATIQLDFNLPLQFELKYADHNGNSTPIMIHRAIFGSIGRFMAILLEHTNGRLPFW